MEKLDENLQDLMWQVRERTLQQMQTSFEVDQKTQFNGHGYYFGLNDYLLDVDS